MNNEKNKKIEEIMGSLDGTYRASIPDFFYTRLKARMEKSHEPAGQKSGILRPVYAIAAMVVIILVNAVVIYKENTVADIDLSQSVAAEYSLNDNSISLYDLNMDK